MMKKLGVLAVTIYAACIVAANYAIHRYGFVPVGFGLLAPAGTYFAGITFVARDVVQMTLGRRWAIAAIAAGALLSWQTSASLAAASGIAFLVGELADWAVYTPLAERGRVALGVLLADTAGLFVDTFLFLHLAFGSVAHWQGTALGKEWMTLAALPIIVAARRIVPRRLANA